MPPFPTDDPVAWSVSVSVTLVYPAKVVGQNEMPFGRETSVVPGNIALDRGHWKERFGGVVGNRNFQSNFALQIVAKPLQSAECLL